MRILVLCLLLTSCNAAVKDIYEVPANPTYDKDVRFYLADHCVWCHGSPPNRGAPSNFRLDVYDDSENPHIRGVHTMSNSILDSMEDEMPPGGGLGPNGKEMIRIWVENGAPR